MNEHLKHMDVGSRNARLCETLQGMGLFVLPVFAEDDPERLDHMLVSAGLPTLTKQVAKNATSATVAVPVTSSQVAQHIQSAQPAG